MDSRIKRAKMVDQFMTIVFYGIALFFFLLLVGFAGKVIVGGLLGAKPEMFGFTRSGSIGNQVFNTIYLVFISLLVSVPVGVLAGIYLAMYAKPGLVTCFLRTCIETLSSLPSIVVGLFGYLIFLVVLGLSKSLLAGALSISILSLPLITTTTEDAIKGLPAGYYQGSMGLGATKWQTIFHVLLPACLSRIMTGVILAVALVKLPYCYTQRVQEVIYVGTTLALPLQHHLLMFLDRQKHYPSKSGTYKQMDKIEH